MTEQTQTPPPAAPPKKPKKQRAPSRSQRWSVAVEEAKAALSEITAKLDDLESALAALTEVQQEYSDWKDNLPENLQSSALGEKLEEVCGLQLEDAADGLRSAADEIESTLGDAEGMDLPQGFGRD